jgi:hypothetical protein
MSDFRLGDDIREVRRRVVESLIHGCTSSSAGVLTSGAFTPKPASPSAGRTGAKSTEKYLPFLQNIEKLLNLVVIEPTGIEQRRMKNGNQ